jgi:hypothetical protein
MAVLKYRSRRDGCTEILKWEEGWLDRNTEAGGGIAE